MFPPARPSSLPCPSQTLRSIARADGTAIFPLRFSNAPYFHTKSVNVPAYARALPDITYEECVERLIKHEAHSHGYIN